MKTKRTNNTLVCRATLFLLALAFLDTNLNFVRAQDTAFTYQGRLDLSGSPANGVYDFTFALFGGSSGGSAVAGPVTNSAVGISNGLFTVALDFGNPFPGADRWLEIGVRTNGSAAFTNLSPRQQITSTPYAIQSANAVNVSGSIPASQLTGTISSNNIGAGSITTVMLAAGAVGSNQLAAGAVTTPALADGAVTSAKMYTTSNSLELTIIKPSSAAGDLFGTSVATVGTDHVLIGASDNDTGATNAGAAYLFSTGGMLVTTFTNPTPAAADLFGYSVAAVGADRVLIGAYQDDTGAINAGAAYLFNINGTLLTTFANPTPAPNDNFGYSVAAVGGARVLIGAWQDDTGAADAGAAYLFSTNGTLLTTFTNPTPDSGDVFGHSVAAVGADRVLIGAFQDDTVALHAGAAYLFNTNGTLLTTFTPNPTTAADDLFGSSVAAVGPDRVLIGARSDDTGATSAGAAYLFSTNGTLLTTFTNPTPADFEVFGYSVAAVGPDRVLIGARSDDTGAADAGAAYLFSTNGTLLNILTNPTPAAGDDFGISVTAVGADRVLIGAPRDDTGATNAGAAYLFGLETFTPGLIADGVNAGSLTTASLEDGAVTLAKLDPSIGVWTRAGTNIFRTSGNVGIGTVAPGDKLSIKGGALSFHHTSNDVPYGGLDLDPTGDSLRIRGNIGSIALNTDYVTIQRTTGNVGIGTTSPTAKLSVNGTANNNTGTWGIFSDDRLKADIQPMEAGSLDRLLQLKGMTYHYNKPELREGYNGLHRGWIAQEVETVFPEWVSEAPDGMKMVTPVGFNALTVEALRELQQKQEASAARFTEELRQREAENAELKQRLETLERLLDNKPHAGKERATTAK